MLDLLIIVFSILSKVKEYFGRMCYAHNIDNGSVQQNIRGVINFGVILQTQTSIDFSNTLQQNELEKLGKLVRALNAKNTFQHSVAIWELKQMANQNPEREELHEIICDILCQYLSIHTDSIYAINALFKKESVFNQMKKEINNANFNKLKLRRSYSVNNVRFLNCKFIGCHFNKMQFKHCIVSGGEIDDCLFKDGIKISGCKLIGVDMKKLYFRHAQFADLSVRGGIISSYTASRSEFRGVSFVDMNWQDTLFQTCEFQNYDFSQIKMNDVKFEFKNSNNACIKEMFEYLCHIGHKPSIERDTGTIVVI